MGGWGNGFSVCARELFGILFASAYKCPYPMIGHLSLLTARARIGIASLLCAQASRPGVSQRIVFVPVWRMAHTKTKRNFRADIFCINSGHKNMQTRGGLLSVKCVFWHLNLNTGVVQCS